MSTLQDLQPNASVRGVLPDCLVTVVNVQWFGSEALELTYKDPTGRVANQLLYRHDEPRLEVVEQGRPWSFDGDGELFRLVSEAHRIRLAHRQHGRSVSISESGRRLLLADEVRRMPGDLQLLFVKGMDPLMVERVTYLNDSKFAGRADPNPLYAPVAT